MIPSTPVGRSVRIITPYTSLVLPTVTPCSAPS